MSKYDDILILRIYRDAAVLAARAECGDPASSTPSMSQACSQGPGEKQNPFVKQQTTRSMTRPQSSRTSWTRWTRSRPIRR